MRRDLGQKIYELSNHLGNVLVTVSDKKIYVEDAGSVDHFLPEIMSISDYYPFGSPIFSRAFACGEYRFGFNGMERDDEVKGVGNSLDFGARIYDSRLGRWLALDPLFKIYPNISSLTYGNNSPIYVIDISGEYIKPANDKTKEVIESRLKSIVGDNNLSLFFEYSVPPPTGTAGHGGVLYQDTRVHAFAISQEIESKLKNPDNITKKDLKKAIKSVMKDKKIKIPKKNFNSLLDYSYAAASQNVYEVAIFNEDATIINSGVHKKQTEDSGEKLKRNENILMGDKNSIIIDGLTNIELRNINPNYNPNEPKYRDEDMQQARNEKKEYLDEETGTSGYLITPDKKGKGSSVSIKGGSDEETSARMDNAIKDLGI